MGAQDIDLSVVDNIASCSGGFGDIYGDVPAGTRGSGLDRATRNHPATCGVRKPVARTTKDPYGLDRQDRSRRATVHTFCSSIGVSPGLSLGRRRDLTAQRDSVKICNEGFGERLVGDVRS